MPPAFLHAFADFIAMPCPLQEFFPLHAFLAVLHAEDPLQELVP